MATNRSKVSYPLLGAVGNTVIVMLKVWLVLRDEPTYGYTCTVHFMDSLIFYDVFVRTCADLSEPDSIAKKHMNVQDAADSTAASSATLPTREDKDSVDW